MREVAALSGLVGTMLLPAKQSCVWVRCDGGSGGVKYLSDSAQGHHGGADRCGGVAFWVAGGFWRIGQRQIGEVAQEYGGQAIELAQLPALGAVGQLAAT
jgi:hypothetical protein